ncbi:MAG: AI-2E family transporter [Massilia sp.]
MPTTSSFPRLRARTVIAATCILGLLHFGRDFLEPLVLAMILSLVIAPLVRIISRSGLGHFPATIISVMLAALGVVGISVMLASQMVAVTAELPQYGEAIQTKIEQVRELTERPFARIEAGLKAVAPPVPNVGRTPARAGAKLVAGQMQAVPVEIQVPKATATDTLTRLLSVVSGPAGEAGVVLVLMVFVLLEHESLRDRVVQLTGNADVGRTMKALADATEGVSRFFFAQFIVNLLFGSVVGLVLWSAGVPHAMLFGTLSALLRFVPYLGTLVAGAAIAMFVAAIDSGWTLTVSCLALLGSLEMLVANLVEPKIYGRSSGLSPLAVMVSALFWSALWGPVGLLLSTPLTLCLVVAGRYVQALEPIAILLSDTPRVDAAQRFYHRILLGEAAAIIRDARTYLRERSFADYCDHVLLPGLALGVDEFDSGAIDQTQQHNIRTTIAALAETLIPAPGASWTRSRRPRSAVLEANVGAHLRQVRQQHLGRWQGSLDVPPHSVVLCVGLPTERDELLNELFIMALRELDIDARSGNSDGPREAPDPEKGKLVATVFITYPLENLLPQWLVTVETLRANLPDALFVTLRLLSEGNDAKEAQVARSVDMVLHSFEEGVALVTPGHTS